MSDEKKPITSTSSFIPGWIFHLLVAGLAVMILRLEADESVSLVRTLSAFLLGSLAWASTIWTCRWGGDQAWPASSQGLRTMAGYMRYLLPLPVLSITYLFAASPWQAVENLATAILHFLAFMALLPGLGVLEDLLAGPGKCKPRAFFHVLAILGFAVWGGPLLDEGQGLGHFSTRSFILTLLTITIFWRILGAILTIREPRITRAHLWAHACLFHLVVTTLSGLFLTLGGLRWLGGTHFITGHVIYAVGGVLVFALLGCVERDRRRATGGGHPILSTLAFWLIFIGFQASFLPLFVLGASGMPRPISRWPAHLESSLWMSWIGLGVLSLGMLILWVPRLRRCN